MIPDSKQFSSLAPVFGNSNINLGAPKLNLPGTGMAPALSFGNTTKTPKAPLLNTPKPGMTGADQRAGSVNKSTALGPELPQLYHGTNETFKPGAIIKPTPGAISTPENEKTYAWASKTPITSHKYAQGAAMAGSKTEKGWAQPSIWGAVYKVKPIDSSEVASRTNEFANANSQSRNAVTSGLHFVSKKGFQVEGLDHLAENPDITRPNPVKPSNIKPKTPPTKAPSWDESAFVAKNGRPSGI